MFVRAGSGAKEKNPSLNDSFTQVITQIASALSPNVPTSSANASASLPNTSANSPRVSRNCSLGTSPAKLIDNRSKCYKQLADLNNLKQSGLLNDEKYAAERKAIMEVLKQLKEK